MSNPELNPSPTRRTFLRLAASVPFVGLLAACGANAVSGALSTPTTAPPSVPSKPSASVPGSITASPSASAATVASSAGAASAAGAACTLTAEQEEGPFYVAGQAIRQDVTSGKTGVPLQLRLTVLDSAKCAPLQNAAVDIWHADPSGAYSSASGGSASTLFLRGTQLTDANGQVQFTTVYPGWYQGRAVHVHLKVRVGGAAGATYTGGHGSHTGQMFFPEDVSDQVFKLAPYASHNGARTLQAQDMVWTQENGSVGLLKVTPTKQGSIGDGFVGELTVGVDPNATPAAVGVGGGGPPGGRRPPG